MYWKTDDTYGDLQLLEKELKKNLFKQDFEKYYQKEYFEEISAWIKIG